MAGSLDHLALQDQPTLDSSQLFVLKTAIQNIDHFFTMLQNPHMSAQKMKQDTAKEESVAKNRFSIQGNRRDVVAGLFTCAYVVLCCVVLCCVHCLLRESVAC